MSNPTHDTSISSPQSLSVEPGSDNTDPNQAAAPQTPIERDLGFAAITAAVYLLFLQIVARVQGHIGLILATTLTSLLFTLLFTVYLARGLRTTRALTVVGLTSCLLIAPSVVIPLLVRMHPEWSIWPALWPHFRAYRLALHALAGVDGVLMVAAAVSIGVLISRVVREFKMLLPIAVVLSIIDMYVVFGGGLVTQAVHGNGMSQKLMTSLTVQLPTVHPATGALPMQLELGFADFLFIGLFFACFAKFGTPSRRTFQVLCCALAGVMVLVAIKDLALPALVPIAVVVIGMNVRRFQFKRDEVFAMLYAAIIVCVIIVLLVVKSHRGVHN